jgi:O-antigen ligase
MITAHLQRFKDLYIMLLLWAALGAFLPKLVVAGIVVLSFLLVLRTRDLSKIFVVFIATLIFSDSRSSMFAFAETAKIGVVVLTLIYIAFNFDLFKSVPNVIFKYFLPFLAFAVLAAVWSQEKFTAFQKAFSYGLVYFVLPLLFLKAFFSDKSFIKDVLVFFFLILSAGLVIHAVNPEFTSLVGRYRGLLGNPNGLGIFLTVMFPLIFLLGKEIGDQFKENRFHFLLYAVFGWSLVLTGSRTSLIAILIFVLFNRLRYLSNAVSFILFIALIFSYEYLLSTLPSIIEFLGLAEYFRLDTLEEGSGRFVAWSFAWQRVQEVFFVGGGFGYTEYIFKQYFAELSRLGHQGNAHNSFLTLWLDTGVIGILLFATGLLRTALLAIKNSPYALPVIFSVLFSTYFESWLAASLNPFTGLFVISLTVLINYQNLSGEEMPTEDLSK